MRQTLPSEGGDEEEIHYSAAPSRTDARAQPNRASLFPHLHHREEVRGCGLFFRTAHPPHPHLSRRLSTCAPAATPMQPLHSSEDGVLVERLSPRKMEGQRPEVGCSSQNMAPALKGAAPWKMTLAGCGGGVGKGGGGTPFLNLNIIHLHICD